MNEVKGSGSSNIEPKPSIGVEPVKSDVASTTATSTPAVTPVAASTESTSVTPPVTPLAPAKKKGKGCIVVIIVLLVLVAILCGCGFFALRSAGLKLSDLNSDTLQEKIQDGVENKVKETIEKEVDQSIDQNAEPDAGMSVYESGNFGYTLQYPENWTYTTDYSETCSQDASDSGPCEIVEFYPSGETYRVIIIASGVDMPAAHNVEQLTDGAFENADDITFGGTIDATVSKKLFVKDGKTKEVFYNNGEMIDLGDVRFSAFVTSTELADNYDSVELSAETIAVADKMFGTIETFNLQESVDEFLQMFQEQMEQLEQEQAQ